MECLVRYIPPAVTTTSPKKISLFRTSRSRSRRHINAGLNAKLNLHVNDPLFQAAANRASLRFQETLRPEPLFVDPYAGCFVSPNNSQTQTVDFEQVQHQYCLGTRFIDDRLLSVTKNMDGTKQVVLLTDGMDTRAYRLRWPKSTIIFDVSPDQVFEIASEKLRDVGAEIPRGCLLFHVPFESANTQEALRDKGFNGNRPSIWALQGLPVVDLTSFKEILFMVSSLATKGCLFLGELPAWLRGTETRVEAVTDKWMDELFMSYGFRVEIIGYDSVARDLAKVPRLGDHKNVLFVAEHLRFSDDQMEAWRREFQRLEEDGDEEGFEEL